MTKDAKPAQLSGWLISRVSWPDRIDTLKVAFTLKSEFEQDTRWVPDGSDNRRRGVENV